MRQLLLNKINKINTKNSKTAKVIVVACAALCLYNSAHAIRPNIHKSGITIDPVF